MTHKIKLKYKAIRELLDIEPVEFEKYVGPLINLANRFAGGTKARVVGQMTELIKEFEGKGYPDWEKWYLERHGDKLEIAQNKISEMLKKMKKAFNGISEGGIEMFVKDLVLAKTFIGLRLQEAILKAVAKELKQEWRWALPVEEAKNVDGFIARWSVSIKPVTYKQITTKDELPVDIIIWYEKRNDGVKIEYEPPK
jgi:hypothetical protein